MTIFYADFISMGWDSPAGQTYASADDLAKLMMLVFKTDQPVNSTTGQVKTINYTCTILN